MEYVGMGSLYEGPGNAFIFPDLMIRVRVKENVILPKFLSFYLDSHFARHYFRKHAFGTAGSMPKISQGVIEKLRVPVPPIRAQEQIVERITEVFAMAKVVQTVAEEQLKRTYELEQSMLRKAFTGELVSQDLNDEPAYALLARIRKQGTKVQVQTGSKRNLKANQ
jgi:type I restriction enzyme S subunit